MRIRAITWYGLAMGLLAIVIRIYATPEFIEQYYSRGLFQVIRMVLDFTIGYLPIPAIYLFLVVAIVYLSVQLRTWYRSEGTYLKKIATLLLGLLSLLGGIIALFLLIWGYNYGRVPLEKQLQFRPTPVSLSELRHELEVTTSSLVQLRSTISQLGDKPVQMNDLPVDLEAILRASLVDWLQEHNYPTAGRVRGRILLPKGIFLRFSSSGLYFPFTGEGNIDGGLLASQRPFVLAHELAHGYGFGDEGLCNFLAYMACMRTANPVLQYCGQLGYYRYVASDYLRYAPEAYQKFRAALPAGIQNDLNAINDNLRAYPDIMPRLRYAAYDTYLKTQGIAEGMDNYNRVVTLVRAYRASQLQ